MKYWISITSLIVIWSCSPTRFVDSWRNKEIEKFDPAKILVLGITDNLTAKRIFEERLTASLTARGINAHESNTVLEGVFPRSKQSREEIAAMKGKLVSDGFDSVIITAVIGVDDKRFYRSGYPTFGPSWWYRFGPYYFRFQDIYYTPGYYDDYKVFHVETSIYDIIQEGEKALVWVGSFDIVDPQGIHTTVTDYVARIVERLEKDGVVPTIPQS